MDVGGGGNIGEGRGVGGYGRGGGRPLRGSAEDRVQVRVEREPRIGRGGRGERRGGVEEEGGEDPELRVQMEGRGRSPGVQGGLQGVVRGLGLRAAEGRRLRSAVLLLDADVSLLARLARFRVGLRSGRSGRGQPLQRPLGLLHRQAVVVALHGDGEGGGLLLKKAVNLKPVGAAAVPDEEKTGAPLDMGNIAD